MMYLLFILIVHYICLFIENEHYFSVNKML